MAMEQRVGSFSFIHIPIVLMLTLHRRRRYNIIMFNTRVETWCTKDLKKRIKRAAKKLKVRESEVGRRAFKMFLKTVE